MKKSTLLLYAFFSLPLLWNRADLHGQNVGINSTGATPNTSAMLDVDASNKGLLIPRVSLTSTTDVATVPSPANSLLVYNTNASMTGGGTGYWYFDSASNTWRQLQVAGLDWLLLGNSGTVDGVNFLGTTDSVAFNIRVNNQKSGRIAPNGPTLLGYKSGVSNTDAKTTGIGYFALNANISGIGNTALGYRTLSSNTTGGNNIAIGSSALYSNVAGNGNIACGVNALYNNIADGNIAIGQLALYNNVGSTTTGNYNVAIGGGSLYSNVSGRNNTAVGVTTLYNNFNGNYNAAVGQGVLQANTTGSSNTGMGTNSLFVSTTGSNNTSTGAVSLYSNTTGSNNTANGANALFNNISGNYNTAIGSSAYFSGTAYNNSTALGANSFITASNQVRVGDGNVTSIGGQVGWTTLSDGRFKTDINEAVPGLEFISKLRPVTYHINPDAMNNYLHIPDSLRNRFAEQEKSKMLQTGFIAQEVEKAAQELGFDFSGVDKPKNNEDYYGLRYAEFTVPLVKAVQELNATNNELKRTILEMQKTLSEQQKQLDDLKKK